MTPRRLASLSTALFLLLASCTTQVCEVPCDPYLVRINIIDQNGTSETISNPERLEKYLCVDFLKPQPYQKVLRIFSRDECGNVSSIITSYHPNGFPWQYLEVVNGRAKGSYQEWYHDGTQKISGCVIGGNADLTEAAISTWLFEGVNRVWDEEGNLQAELLYSKGDLNGLCTYYHSNGNIWKRIPFQRNQIEGVIEIFLENGDLFQTSAYTENVKNGPSIRYWAPDNIASEECYNCGKLDSGRYYDRCGKLIAEVVDGTGLRAVFGKESVTELQEYQNGVQDGEVQVFAKMGGIVQTYKIKNGLKHGEEYWYYDRSSRNPKLMITWYEGKVQGTAKTWYPNGNPESQREMSNNTKSGLSTAWYLDGSLMLIEEYEKDKLTKGEYYKKGDHIPVSQVIDGRGTATLFDPEGNFLQKVDYLRGSPEHTD